MLRASASCTAEVRYAQARAVEQRVEVEVDGHKKTEESEAVGRRERP
jgi:hypothetical protein